MVRFPSSPLANHLLTIPSRHDLRPAAAAQVATAEGEELPPPLTDLEAPATGETPAAYEAATSTPAAAVPAADAPQRNRVVRFLNLNHLRSATAEERMAALRQLREQSREEHAPEITEDAEGSGTRTRLSGRLRDTFRIRTRRQEPPVPQTQIENETPSA